MEKQANKFVQRATQIFGETPTEPEKEQFLLIIEREAITSKALQSIESTKKTLNDITPFTEFAPWISVLSEPLRKALDRGVKIRWITNKPANLKWPESLQNCINHPNFKLRFIPSLPEVKMGIFDDKELILGIFAKSSFGSPCLYSINPSLVTLAENYFEICWKKGTDPKLIVH